MEVTELGTFDAVIFDFDGTLANSMASMHRAYALWAGGAEAMTIQGQRVISTTGIKCVGNTVVLHGIPYAPPYVIEAIGDQGLLLAALDESPSLQIYRQYVDAYGLGYTVERSQGLEFSAFSGSTGVRLARVAG